MKKSCILTVTALLALACAQPAREYSNTIAVDPDDSPAGIISKAAHVVPTANQMRALEREFIAFAHFGPNTFTAKEWGSGMEDPGVFDLKTLDTDQWCRALKAAGMKMIILTVKHHDGFVLWQSRYTTHGVMSSPFQDGKGDVFKSLSQSCAKYGLDLGFYLSPADLYQIESSDGKIAKTIIDHTKNKDQTVLTLDSMQSTPPEAQQAGATYLSVMEDNLAVLKEALK